MAAGSVARQGMKQVKPILSLDRTEARHRVLNLYKAWYRQVPHILHEYHLEITIEEGRQQVRKCFLKNKHVTDVRAIDLLVIKGQMDLVETVEIWKQRSHIMMYFDDTVNPKPSGFLSKFYEGQ